MNRIRFLLVPAFLCLAAFAPARATLSVDGVFCNNNGGGTFGCYADVSGGTGVYTSYAWRFTERLLNYTYAPTYTTTYDQTVYDYCTVGRSVSVLVTVTDSQGATASGTAQFYCSQWAD